MIMPYYNFQTGQTELRDSPTEHGDEVCKRYIPQDSECQAEYDRLRTEGGMNRSDAFWNALKFALKHHLPPATKDTPHT